MAITLGVVASLRPAAAELAPARPPQKISTYKNFVLLVGTMTVSAMSYWAALTFLYHQPWFAGSTADSEQASGCKLALLCCTLCWSCVVTCAACTQQITGSSSCLTLPVLTAMRLCSVSWFVVFCLIRCLLPAESCTVDSLGRIVVAHSTTGTQLCCRCWSFLRTIQQTRGSFVCCLWSFLFSVCFFGSFVV